MKLLISVFLAVVLLNTFYCRRLDLLQPLPFYQDRSGSYSEAHDYSLKGHTDTDTIDKDSRLGIDCGGITWENNEKKSHDSKDYNEGDHVSFNRAAQVPPPAPQGYPSNSLGMAYNPYGPPSSPYSMPPANYPPYGVPNGSPYGTPGSPPYGAPNGSPYGMPPGNPSYGASNVSPYGMPGNPPCGAPNGSPYGNGPCG